MSETTLIATMMLTSDRDTVYVCTKCTHFTPIPAIAQIHYQTDHAATGGASE